MRWSVVLVCILLLAVVAEGSHIIITIIITIIIAITITITITITIIITINHHHHHNPMNHPHHQHCASWKAVIDSHDGAREKVPDDWGVIQTICQRCILARLIITIIIYLYPTLSSTLTIVLVHYYQLLQIPGGIVACEGSDCLIIFDFGNVPTGTYKVLT